MRRKKINCAREREHFNFSGHKLCKVRYENIFIHISRVCDMEEKVEGCQWNFLFIARARIERAEYSFIAIPFSRLFSNTVQFDLCT